MELTDLVLTNLVKSDGYIRKVIPFLKPEYFANKPHRIVFEIIDKYILDYNENPSISALLVELEKVKGLNQRDAEDTKLLIEEINATESNENEEWLIDQTEEFCQDQALYNALLSAISITEEKKDAKGLSKGAIPELFQAALAVSFDSSVGHDWSLDAAMRYDRYHTKALKIKFDIELLNIITNGGIEPKTLNILAAGTGVGKSLAMCHMSAANLLDGKNVLYISMEMSEEKVAERIDANLLDIKIGDLSLLPKENFLAKVARVKEKITGRLIIKEYPTTCAGVGHFRHLLNELKLKNNFVPDIIYIDYLNLCMSARLKFSGVNSYNYVKSVAEEIRGLAVEFAVPIVSATQLNRTGYSDSDAGIEHTSDSFGLPMTADFMLVMLQSEDMEKLGQILFKQTTKNRYGDPAFHKRFVVGVDRSHMRLYNVDQSAQDDIIQDDDDSSPFDNSRTGERIEDEGKKRPKFNKSAFKDFS